MSVWKLGKTQYSSLRTTTSAGTLTLIATSEQFQVLDGSANHTVVLPNATTTSNGLGISFTIVNESTGTITVQYNDATTLTTIPTNSTKEFFLTDASTSNGVWTTIAINGASGGGIGAVSPGAAKTANYTVVSGDNAKPINVDTTSGAINITLPAPSAGFLVTIKDISGTSSSNPITIVRNGSEKIENISLDFVFNSAYGSVTLISNGTDWSIAGSYSRINIQSLGRGLFAGGSTGVANVSTIDYVTIATTGNAASFGTMSSVRGYNSALASSVRGLFGGGYNGTANVNTIEYVTIATVGTGTSFGNLTAIRWGISGSGNQTRGLFNGGSSNSSVAVNNIDYVTIATTGNATAFGTLTSARMSSASFASPTRSVTAGGDTGGADTGPGATTIDYVTIATTGNAASFGSLALSKYQVAGCSSSVRGLAMGGNQAGSTVSTIDTVIIASTGNSASFGNLSVARRALAACSSETTALAAGGTTGSVSNAIDYSSIATSSTALSFGNLTSARSILAGCSNAHGGV